MADFNTEVNVVKVEDQGISKVGELLVNKVSDCIGGVLAPFQLVRMTEAECEADLMRAKNAIKITGLNERAALRFLGEQAKQQKTIEDIVARAVPLLKDSFDPSKLNEHWTRNFVEKARMSDEEMQTLWSRVLAGEANAPGAFSKRAINVLNDLEASDARLFSVLFDFSWDSIGPVVLRPDDKIYSNRGISWDSLRHLGSLGLISFEAVQVGFQQQGIAITAYFGKPLWLGNRTGQWWTIQTGHVIFTKVGEELLRVCHRSPVEGFWEYVCDKWSEAILDDGDPISEDECAPYRRH